MTFDPGITTTTGQAGAQISRTNALDRLRSLLGPAFTGAAVTTEYGAPGVLNGMPHSGIDLAAAEWTPIQNPIGGTVSSIWHDNVGGNQVSVKTPEGYTQIFAHLAAIPAGLAQGSEIQRGAVIGYVGHTGQATGSHLHYEVTTPSGHIGTIWGTVDPLAFIGEFADKISGSRLPPDVAERGVTPTASNNYGIGAGRVSAIKDFLNGEARLNALGVKPASQSANDLRAQFPDVPLPVLRQIAYGQATGIAGFLDNPLTEIAANVTRLTGDLTDPHTWARVGLTLAAVGVIVLGVVIYVGSAGAPKTVRAL